MWLRVRAVVRVAKSLLSHVACMSLYTVARVLCAPAWGWAAYDTPVRSAWVLHLGVKENPQHVSMSATTCPCAATPPCMSHVHTRGASATSSAEHLGSACVSVTNAAPHAGPLRVGTPVATSPSGPVARVHCAPACMVGCVCYTHVTCAHKGR